MSLIHNEQTKLTATWFNTIGTAAMTVGVLAPVATALYGFAATPLQTETLVIGALAWLLAGLSLHLTARFVLRGLRP
ncbi:hypothetical protein GDR74_05345 [Microvirga thermotolerans]|uniref:Amino acid transporter n=1 Tax=Microvirga thermotolerans TaxID=2651334 RepID=A0A5P9JVK5_9HYPH|nr:hypothetical protein GDR74_05345 [Microvirga thermotolerans]